MQIKNPSDTIPFNKGIASKKQEHVGIIMLDCGHNVITKKDLFIGGTSRSLVDTKIVFWELCRKNASAFIVYHNHPCGNESPSSEDITMTKCLQNAGEILGIQLLDHVIVTKYSYKSFRESNLI